MVVQLRWRARQEMKMQRAFFLRLQRTALAIQTQYRMVRAQKQHKDTIAKREVAERAAEEAKRAEEKREQEEASVKEGEDGDETVTMRREEEQMEASVRVGDVEVLRPGSGDKDLVASPPHNVEPDK